MGVIKNEYDVEGYSPTETYPDPSGKQISSRIPVYADESGAVPGESFTVGNSLYARIQRFAGKYGVEPRGIERVPEDERTDKTLAKAGTMVCIKVQERSKADGSNSGLRPTWWYQVSPSEHSPFLSSTWVSSMLS